MIPRCVTRPKGRAYTSTTTTGPAADNIHTEKQQRLLTEPLYSSWTNPDGKPFLALSNVGLFFAAAEPPLDPDAMPSLDVPPVRDNQEPDHRSYLSWAPFSRHVF